MDIKTLTIGLTVAVGAIGPALAIGQIGGSALRGIARNPEASDEIRTTMILAIAFAEAVAIYVLVVALMIKFI